MYIFNRLAKTGFPEYSGYIKTDYELSDWTQYLKNTFTWNVPNSACLLQK